MSTHRHQVSQSAARLRQIILERGEHQYEISKRAGLSETVFSRIVCGRRQTSSEERKRIARALECRVKEIFGVDEQADLSKEAK